MSVNADALAAVRHLALLGRTGLSPDHLSFLAVPLSAVWHELTDEDKLGLLLWLAVNLQLYRGSDRGNAIGIYGVVA